MNPAVYPFQLNDVLFQRLERYENYYLNLSSYVIYFSQKVKLTSITIAVVLVVNYSCSNSFSADVKKSRKLLANICSEH